MIFIGQLYLNNGEGNGNSLQYSCLENPMDGEAWQATVHGVTKSRTRLSHFTHPNKAGKNFRHRVGYFLLGNSNTEILMNVDLISKYVKCEASTCL